MQPIEIFGNVKGMTRDFGIDDLPAGYLWDIADAIPSRKGARVEQRGPWVYHGSFDYDNATIYGGYYAAFNKGEKLLVVSNSKVWDIHVTAGTGATTGAGPPTMQHNGVKVSDRVYWMNGAGLTVPWYTEYTGASPVTAPLAGANTPKGKVGAGYKGRLLLGGDPANPQRVSFSKLEIDGGPPAAWDATSWIDSSNPVTGFAPMANSVLVFHPSAVERIRGTIPPGTNLVTDMYLETLSEQVGCTQPATITYWRENVIFADERGVFLTDGSTIRNLIELGGMGDFWRFAYGSRMQPYPGVSCGVFLDYLIVNVLCNLAGTEFSYTLICDLNTRSWLRFTNFPASCIILSEAAAEQSFCGNWFTRKLMKVSTMFQDPFPIVGTPPDYVDANGVNVLATLTTGFKRLSKEEGLKRIHSAFVSYHHESDARGAIDPNGVKVEYRVDPPRLEDIDIFSGAVAGWTSAGNLPDATEYTRKKLFIGKRGYGVMIRLTALSSSRTSQISSIEIQSTSQDRGKVTA